MGKKKKIILILITILALQIMLPTFGMIFESAIIQKTASIQNFQVSNEESFNENSKKEGISVVKKNSDIYILEENALKDEEKSYSEEWLEWNKLTDEEKKNTLEPRKEFVPFDTLYEGEDVSISTESANEEQSIIERFLAIFQSDNVDEENSIPSTYNLQDTLGEIKAELQSPYNTCYAYPALNAIETYIELTTGNEYDFSEMHVEYMTSTLLGGNRELDSGGNFKTVMDYSLDGKGPVLESDIPKKDYTEDEYETLKNAITIATVQTYKNFPTINKKNNEYTDSELNEFRNVVKSHIMNYGAICAGMYYCTDESNTLSYYNPSTFAYSCLDKSTTMNHAVTIVGWDDNYSKDNFPEKNRPSKDGAYIAINSWGESWGNDGYFYVSYEDIWIESQMNGILSVELLEPEIQFANYTQTENSISTVVTASDNGKSGIDESSLKYLWLEERKTPAESDFTNSFENGEIISIDTNKNLNLWILVENNKGLSKIDVAVGFNSGEGTVENPYLVETPEHLNAIRNNLNANYKLANNIDLEYDTQNKDGKFYNDGKGWKDIGTFSGTLDGNGYSILNLYGSSSENSYGLFGAIKGTVKNIGIYNCEIDAYQYLGGIAGSNSGTIENVYVSGKLEGHACIGGIVGSNSGTIQNCYNDSTVVGQYSIGGINGNNGTKGKILNVYNVGHVGADFNSQVANIVGVNNGTVENAYYINEILNGIGEDKGNSNNVINVNMDDMKNESTYINFDFSNTWEINKNENYKFATLKSVKHVEKEENTIDFAGGNGTLYNPYLISTPMQLSNLRNDLYACYKLTNNIDLEYDTQNENGLFYNDGEGWESLSTSWSDCTFMGVFDGNGYSILNLYINRDNQSQGLFGNTRGLIQNLGLVDNNITGGPFTGGISAVNNFIIQNVYTTGTTSGGGGIVSLNEGKIRNAYNTGYVRGGGGIAAYSDGDTYIIENVYNVGRTGMSYSDGREIHSSIVGNDSMSRGSESVEYNLKNAYYLDNDIGTGAAINTSKNYTVIENYENVEMLSLEQFNYQDSFIGFDFENDWSMPEDGNYNFPVLKNVKHIEKEENKTDFAGGNGTYYNPYLISTPVHLNNIRNDLYACYKLTNDIDLEYDTQNENGLFYNDAKGWNPIGNEETGVFGGKLDGNNYRILNLKIHNTDLEYAGLFGKASDVIITNLKMTYSEVTSGWWSGNLIGQMTQGIIYNIGCSGNITGSRGAGGIVGYANIALVKESFNSSNVYGLNGNIYGGDYCGGIIGMVSSSKVKIEDSYNIGAIKSLNKGQVGGIIGGAFSTNVICINLYNIGDLKTEGEYLGNIIGYSRTIDLDGCYHLDNGLATAGNMEELTKEEYIKDIDEMKMQTTYTEFDFENTWEMVEGKFPTLKGSNHIFLSQIDAENIETRIKQEKEIKIALTPEIVDDAVISYSIENEEIATINNSGNIIGLQVGQTKMKISSLYEEISKTIDISVGEEKVLESIAITTKPNKTSYKKGENFDSNGMVVSAIYDDGSMPIITDYTVVGGTNLNCLVKKVEIRSNANSKIKAEVEIQVAHDIIDATCTEPAKCKIEGCDYTEEALGHSFTNYTSNNDATCTEDGTKTAKCERCYVTDTKVDEGSKVAHKYEEGKCTVCGEEEPKLKITSQEYKIETEYITNIKPKTTIKELKEKIETNGEIKIFKGTKEIVDEKAKVETGMTIKVSLNDEEVEYTLVVIGDCNGTGTTNVSDLTSLMMSRAESMSSKQDESKILKGAFAKAVDMDGNGKIGISDITLLCMYIVANK